MSNAARSPRYIKMASGFLMVLRQGDELFGELQKFALAEQMPAASFVGFGFAGMVRFGFFDFDRNDYAPKTFEDLEMTSANGSLAWNDDAPSIHAHGTGCNRDFAAVGGHILALTVGRGSFEITITPHDRRLQRTLDPAIGANVLQL